MQKDTTSESDTQFQAPMTASDDDLGRVDCGPSQPKLASFPKGRKNRCFRAIWYESFRWLEYSVKQDRAFCFACRNVSTSTSKSDIAFTKLPGTLGPRLWKQIEGYESMMHAVTTFFL